MGRPLGVAGLLLFPLLLVLIGTFGERLGPGPRTLVDRPGSLASTMVVDDDEIDRGLPLVSLWIEPDDLHDPVTGLLANVQSRGRAWERTASLSYFDEGELRFDGAVGVRLHGGSSRTRSAVQSFRVYFRDEYGPGAFPPGLLFGGTSDPLRRLVLHNDLRERRMPPTAPGLARERGFWSFTNPLAYDIAERIGAVVPHTKPVRFFLNGEGQGVYVVTEYVDPETNPDFFRVRWGHDRFSADPSAMESLSAWLETLPPPLTARALSERVDVDNLTRWFLSVLFCATRDAFQGPGQFRDDAREAGGWFWINWDMDSSFRSPRLDSFYLLLDQPGERRRGRRRSEPRATMLTRLLADDPGYVDHFKYAFTRMLNHQVTPTFLEERLTHYDAIAREYGVEDLRFLEVLDDFLTNRHDMLWELASQQLDTAPPARLRVEAPPGGLVVDGSLVTGSFEGHRFPGMTVELALPESSSADVAHWTINGEVRDQEARSVTILMERDLTIQVVSQ